jgi:hypothetical protein
MRRSLIMLALATGAALTTAAQAQTGPGSIYYRYTASTNDAYKVSGDGTNNTKLSLLISGNVRLSTSLATYPGGRQFFATSAVLGPIPSTSTSYGDLLLYSEQGGVATKVTNLRGPQYLDQNAPRIRSSNNHQDSFFSFVVYDARIASYLLVRYNGPISDIFLPTFAPFVADDSRLVVLTTTKIEYEHYAWDPTGRLLTYNDRDANGKQLTHLYDVATNTSTLINNPAVSGVELTSPWCSPTELRFFSQATYKDGTVGIVSFYPTTGQFSWVIKEGGKGNNLITAFTATAISPDGTTLAFGLLHLTVKQTVPSLVRIPVNGGNYTTLLNFPAVPVFGNPLVVGTWR